MKIWEHQLFEGLPEFQRQWLSERIEIKTFPPKSIIFQPGELSSQLYFLIEGRVKTEIFEGSTKWLILDVVGPNEFFGMKGLAGQPVREAFARTFRSSTKVAIINNADLHNLMEANFCFMEKMLSMVAEKIAEVENRTVAQYTSLAPARIAAFLLKQIKKGGKKNGREWFYDSQLTQEEIGAYIGTGRQTITEILTELKTRNILTYNWGKFWIHELEKLKKL